MRLKLSILVFLICNILGAQERIDFQLKSVTVGPGTYFLEKIEGNSFIASSDVSFALDKNLFSASLNLGYGILNKDEILKNTIHSFVIADVLYGRKVQIIKNLNFNPAIGIGYIKQTKLKNEDRGSAFNKTIRGIICYDLSEKFALGFMYKANFNDINNLYAYHIVLSFNL